jgi:hypothetical protein
MKQTDPVLRRTYAGKDVISSRWAASVVRRANSIQRGEPVVLILIQRVSMASGRGFRVLPGEQTAAGAVPGNLTRLKAGRRVQCLAPLPCLFETACIIEALQSPATPSAGPNDRDQVLKTVTDGN